MSKVIIPIGYDAGPLYPTEGPPNPEPEGFEIIHHTRATHLPKYAYGVWFASFYDPEAHADLTFTRDHLIKLASAGEVDAEDVVRRLVKAKLLVEFEPDTDEAIDLLKNYQIYTSAEGLGSTPERPGLYRIGKQGQTMMEVRNEVYALWAGSFSVKSIWDAVVDYAAGNPDGSPFPTPETLGHMFAKAIPMLVGSRVAHLQPIS